MAYPYSNNPSADFAGSGIYYSDLSPSVVVGGLIDNRVPINRDTLKVTLGYQISLIQNFINERYIGRPTIPVNQAYINYIGTYENRSQMIYASNIDAVGVYSTQLDCDHINAWGNDSYLSTVYIDNAFITSLHADITDFGSSGNPLTEIYATSGYIEHLYVNDIGSYENSVYSLYLTHLYVTNVGGYFQPVENGFFTNLGVENRPISQIYCAAIGNVTTGVSEIFAENIYAINIGGSGRYSENIYSNNVYSRNIGSFTDRNTMIYAQGMFVHGIGNVFDRVDEAYFESCYVQYLAAPNLDTSVAHISLLGEDGQPIGIATIDTLVQLGKVIINLPDGNNPIQYGALESAQLYRSGNYVMVR